MSTTAAPRLFPSIRDAPALLALTLAFCALAVWGLQYAVTPGAGVAFWPAAGVAYAGLVLGGIRLWPAIFVGRLLAAAIVSGGDLKWTALVFALAATLGAAAPLLATMRLRPLDPRLNGLWDMARVAVLGAGLGALVSGLTALPAMVIVSGSLERALAGTTAWGFGVVTGVLTIAPLLLVWSVPESWRASPREWLHLGGCLAVVTAVALVAFCAPMGQQTIRTWHVFPMLVWAALAFNVRGASAALLITTSVAVYSAFTGEGMLARQAQGFQARLLLAQQFVMSSSLTILLLAAVADERRGRARLARSEAQLRAETEALETLNHIGEQIAAQLDIERLVNKVTDAGVALTGARCGAFLYAAPDAADGKLSLYALSGASREDVGPAADAAFEPAALGEVARLADAAPDPEGLGPLGRLPARSRLTVPVRLSSGEVVGALVLGHPDPGVFDDRAERLATGLAAQAAVALDNARLYQAAQTEIAERTRAEQHQRLLVHELNHRVKNTLATVQSIAAQTTRSLDPKAGYEDFTSRLVALSRAHDVLTRQRWEGAELKAIAEGAVQPFEAGDGGRFTLSGPRVWLEPQHALALAMALHELATNAAKYGALSRPEGRVSLTWASAPGGGLTMTWRETGGPPVAAPSHRGFGSRLLERGLAGELGGEVSVDYRREGLVCTIAAKSMTADDERPQVMQL